MSYINAVNNELENLDILIKASEDWAKGYSKDKEAHAKLIRFESKLERIMRGYFRELASERLNHYVNWRVYLDKLAESKIKADFNVDVTVNYDNLDDEVDILLTAMHDPLLNMMALGATTAEKRYKIDLGLNAFSDAIMKAAREYTASLVKGINNTTKDRIQQSITSSIALGEDINDATSRLEDVVDDPVRAELIARTESVSAYSQGITEFGRESNATQKVWELSSDPCEICQANYDNTPNGDGVIDFNDDFNSGDSEPPAHPRCRCGFSLIHDYS